MNIDQFHNVINVLVSEIYFLFNIDFIHNLIYQFKIKKYQSASIPKDASQACTKKTCYLQTSVDFVTNENLI